MVLNAKLPHYMMLSLQKEFEDICVANSIVARHQGMHQEVQDLDEWAVFWALWDTGRHVRPGAYLNEFMFQIACHAKLGNEHSARDSNAPWRIAAIIQMAMRHLRVDIKTYDVATHTVLCGARVGEGQAKYVPYRNLTFAGEGNFALEQGTNTHSVGVTFTALLGVGG